MDPLYRRLMTSRDRAEIDHTRRAYLHLARTIRAVSLQRQDRRRWWRSIWRRVGSVARVVVIILLVYVTLIVWLSL